MLVFVLDCESYGHSARTVFFLVTASHFYKGSFFVCDWKDVSHHGIGRKNSSGQWLAVGRDPACVDEVNWVLIGMRAAAFSQSIGTIESSWGWSIDVFFVFGRTLNSLCDGHIETFNMIFFHLWN